MSGGVAALYVDPRGPYPKLLGPEMCWDEERDARTYAGPWPVVAHPPCGPWGRLRHMCTKQVATHAVHAVQVVQAFGGVLEHPAGSLLWERMELPRPGELPGFAGGRTYEVEQVRWGHVARKLTWLYVVGVRAIAPMPPLRAATHHISRDAKRARRNGYTLKRTSSAQNRRTPVAFAEWLISLAASATAGQTPGGGERG